MINSSFVDLANVEVGKWPSNTKIKNDHQKILLEAKTIISRILNKYSFINTSSIAVFSLQDCHLKGNLLSSCLGAPKKYFISRVCDRLHVPLSPNIHNQIIELLEKLVFFKEHVEDLGEYIKDTVNANLDKRTSFGKVLGPNTSLIQARYTDWISKVESD